MGRRNSASASTGSSTPAIIGIDVKSAYFAWGRFPDPATGIVRLSPYKSKDPHSKRTRRLAELVDAPTWECIKGATAVYIERPYGPNRNAQSTMMQMQGTFIGALAHEEIPIIEINTSTWRKQVFGGAGNKMLAIQRATDHLGFEPATDDECEALCIAEAGFRRWVLGLDSW